MMSRPTPTPALEKSRRFLDIDASERETLLAALEIAQALTDGDVPGARFLATAAYSAPVLRGQLDALADRVFLMRVLPIAIPRVPTVDATPRRAPAPAAPPAEPTSNSTGVLPS